MYGDCWNKNHMGQCYCGLWNQKVNKTAGFLYRPGWPTKWAGLEHGNQIQKNWKIKLCGLSLSPHRPQWPVSVASFLFIWLRVALYAACVWRRNDVLDTDTDDVISVSTFSILKLQLPISWGGFLFFWGGEGHAKTVAILTDHTSLICFSFLLMWHQWTECRNIPQACHMILPQGRYSFCFCDQQLSVCHI